MSNDRFDVEDYLGLDSGDVLRALVCGASSPTERRALSEGLDTAGGYTVPAVLSAQLIDLMAIQARVMQAGAALIPLDSDRNSFAKQTADPTPSWRGENQLIAESDPTFTQVTFAPKTLAVMVRVSQELLDDSVNIGAALQKSLARAMALEVDRVALLGTGAANEPLGVLNLAGINSVSMGANGAAVTDYTDILDAILAMQEDNAGEPTAAIMAPRTIRAYNGLVDTTGQPMMRPKSIENLPFLETTQMSITQTQGSASNASSVVLGNFSELVIGMRNQLRIEVLKERYREYYQVAFLAAMRVDVQAWHDESFAKIVGIIP
ncbi:MAG: phage major capsid protein [Pirellulales bacterium]|nr:phage major capsid protein [Pirellulales bacterium]